MKKRFSDFFAVSKKRNIVAVSLLGVVALVGGTIAYNNDWSIFRNVFHIGEEVVKYQEDIPFPLEDWSACQEKFKAVTVTNVSGSDKYIRLKFREAWKTADDQTELSLVRDGVTLATPNFDDDWEDYWTLNDDGYYYYNTIVAAGSNTEALLKSVTLSCDANFGKDNVCTETAAGQTCTKPADEYEGAKYHLYIDIEASSEPFTEPPHEVDCEGNLLYDKVACEIAEETDPDFHIDFRKKAVVSDNKVTANGNGVNATTENGKTVYYYRGEIANNNVYWANKCWKILRTTASGGTKIMYVGDSANGVCGARVDGAYPSMKDNVYSFGAIYDYEDGLSMIDWSFYGSAGECEETPWGTALNCFDSRADVGYMHGDREAGRIRDPATGINTEVAFGNDVTWNGSSYTLVNYVNGNPQDSTFWLDSVIANHHYTCWSGTTCSSVDYVTDGASVLRMSGGDKLAEVQAKLALNEGDSMAKAALEHWYTTNLSSYDSQVEDAIFCNDRSFGYGPLHSKDEGYQPGTYGSVYAAYLRNAVETDNNLHPSLNCIKRDSFTVGDYGNGASSQKIGLITADEVTFAGSPTTDTPTSSFFLAGINNINGIYTMTPSQEEYTRADASGMFTMIEDARLSTWGQVYSGDDFYPGKPMYPVVSLKQSVTITSGTGTEADPYVIQ